MYINYCPNTSCPQHRSNQRLTPEDVESTECIRMSCSASKEELRLHGEILMLKMQVASMEERLHGHQ